MVGILVGAALFFAPFFLLRAVIFVAIIAAIFRIAGHRRWYRYRMHPYDTDPYGQAPHIINLRRRDAQDISID